MGFQSYREIDDSRLFFASTRKVVGSTEQSARWYDDSMLSGVPAANYYATVPLTAATLDWRRQGIRHSEGDGETSEHLLSVAFTGGGGTNEGPQHMLLCDYLLYYPFIDGNDDTPQVMDNTVTLPRFTDGVGVLPFIVTLGTGSSNPSYTITYTNEQGVTGRTMSSTAFSALTVSEILGSSSGATFMGPFPPLASGDRGVRAIESIQFTGTPPGGVYAIVLVKPIATFAYAEIGVTSETVFPRLPLIPDGAVLQTVRLAGTNTAAARFFTALYTTIRS